MQLNSLSIGGHFRWEKYASKRMGRKTLHSEREFQNPVIKNWIESFICVTGTDNLVYGHFELHVGPRMYNEKLKSGRIYMTRTMK